MQTQERRPRVLIGSSGTLKLWNQHRVAFPIHWRGTCPQSGGSETKAILRLNAVVPSQLTY